VDKSVEGRLADNLPGDRAMLDGSPVRQRGAQVLYGTVWSDNADAGLCSPKAQHCQPTIEGGEVRAPSLGGPDARLLLHRSETFDRRVVRGGSIQSD